MGGAGSGSEAASREALPTNLALARELLLELGPMATSELRALLRDRAVVVRETVIASLPVNYPQAFSTDDQDRLVAVRERAVRSEPVVSSSALEPVTVVPWTRDRVVVFDLETTGLDPRVDQIWAIAARNLGTGHEYSVRVAVTVESPRVPALPDGVAALPIERALHGLREFIGDAPGLGGHNIVAFDIPFVNAVAERIGSSWRLDAVPFDLAVLSTLALPTIEGRTLEDLVIATDVPHGEFHQALDDVRATIAVMETLLARIDPADASWAVATECLVRGGNAWPYLFPAFEPADPDEALKLPVDPLSAAPSSVPIANPALWASEAFERLASTREGFRARPSQREMSDAVANAFREGSLLAVEAPTGTGKSLAYLLPALARATKGVPVVIATATKVLQQQLRDDAARLLTDGLLPVPVRQVAGVSNYICPREVASSLQDPDVAAEEWVAVAVAVRALAASESGLWSEVSDWMLRSSSPGYVRRRLVLSTTSDGCDRRSCEFVASCPLYTRLEGVSDTPGVLIVNHALMGAWANGRTQGRAAPGDVFADDRADLVVDEAHDLEDTLTAAWTERTRGFDFAVVEPMVFGRRGPVRAAQRAAKVARVEDALGPIVRNLEIHDEELRAAAANLHAAVRTFLHEFRGAGDSVVLASSIHARRPEFRAVQARVVEVRSALRGIIDELAALGQACGAGDGEGGSESTEGGRGSLSSAARRRIRSVRQDLESLSGRIAALRQLPDEHAFVYVLSSDGGRDDRPDAQWAFERIPIDIAARFRDDVVGVAHSVTLTSATLTVHGSFDFVARRLGLELDDEVPKEAEDETVRRFATMLLESPFQHDEQAAVVLTSHIPFPSPSNETEFCQDVAADQVGLLSLTGGRMLTLFAARSRMEHVAGLVAERADDLAGRGVRLLVQGDASPHSIARQFRADPGTVVYGLRSYWQGFDAPGDTLQYLAIEKPPYPHPGDPVNAARQRAVTDAGGDSFLDYTVPRTAIAFAQGFGRLIRHEEDRGVAIVYDRRMQQPTVANQMLLGTIPTDVVHYAQDRDDAWRYALRFVTGTEPDLAAALVADFDRVSGLLEELRIGPGVDPEQALRRGAQLLFGIDELRQEQLLIMLAMLDGRDALGVLPTGFGKSLCFQLPAMLAAGDGVTVVVSPLVALIKDQVDELRGQRGFRAVHGITGATSAGERTEVMRDIATGRTRLLYVSPERFVRDATMLRALEQSEIRAVVIDEAHCVSVWGPDFRPEFRLVDRAVAGLPRRARIALTATATPEVERDVLGVLALRDPVIVRRPVDRANLRFSVRRVRSDKDRARELLRVVTAMGDRPGIVYTGRRATAEEVAWMLRQARITARAYHAGLLREQRDAIQEDFLAGQAQVIVATKAFGMGVNKPDIGWVVHYDLPESLEGYAQEAGRGGRDPSLEAECVLIYGPQDVRRRRAQIGRNDGMADVDAAQRVLSAIAGARRRGSVAVFDPEELADTAGVDVDDLNVVLAWLERSGNLERHTDCALRGTVSKGFREPIDQVERREFRDLFSTVLRTRPSMRRLIDFTGLEDHHGLDPDKLEEQLVRWTLDGLVMFNTSVRGWRVEVHDSVLDRHAYAAAVDEWRAWERRRLDAMIDYAEGSRCRRVSIGRHFGDDGVTCRDAGDVLLCDACSGIPPVWSALADDRVPDPESLFAVDVVALQAIRWTTSYRHGRYGESGIKAALLGTEQIGGRPIGAGLLSCPQFGALRYVRSAQRRLDEAVDHLVAHGMVERTAAEYQGRSYSTLAITDAGRRYLAGTAA